MPRYFYPNARDTVESRRKLSTQFLKEKGYFEKGSNKSGNIQWTTADEIVGNINIQVYMTPEKPRIRLTYRVRERYEEEWTDIDYFINLLNVSCNFGGKRWYFECGVYTNGRFCGRRVSILYGHGKYFCCRHCANLSYDTCNENKRYRNGIFKLFSLSHKAEEYYMKHVKRTHYAGKPTKKYKRYLEIECSYSNEDLLKAETLIRTQL